MNKRREEIDKMRDPFLARANLTKDDTWKISKKDFNEYIENLVDAGFGSAERFEIIPRAEHTEDRGDTDKATIKPIQYKKVSKEA